MRVAAASRCSISMLGPGRGVCAWLALAVVACQASHDQTATLAVDSGGVHIVTIATRPESLVDWTVAPVPVLTVTGAEAGDSLAFALVGAARWLSDGRLVVADAAAHRLFVFDSAGALLRTHGRSGDGPSEFRNITTLDVLRGDTLGIFDRRLRRMSFWHPDDGFARSISLADGGSLDAWPEAAWAWQDSLMVVLQLAITPLEEVPPAVGIRRWPMRAHLTLRDVEGNVLRRSPEFAGMYTGLVERGDIRLPFSNRPFAAVGPDRVYFGPGASFALSYLDREFTWAGDLRWPAREELLTTAEVEGVRAEAQSLLKGRLPPGRVAAAFAQAFAPEILPAVRPQIGRVMVTPDSLVWIERFEAARLGTALQKPGDRWTILKPDGESVAQLRLPPDARLEDVRSGRVILVRRDSLDVQTVAVHALVRP